MDIRFLYEQAERYDIDLLPAIIREVDGSQVKSPAAKMNDYLDPIVSIKSNIPKRTLSAYSMTPYIGVIFKETGTMIDDRYLMCLDVDCKNDTKHGLETFDKLVDIIAGMADISPLAVRRASEKTISGGFHIYCTTNKPTLYSKIKCYIPEKNKPKGTEIEIFTHSRFMVCAPSKGYELLEPLNEKQNSIDFADAYKLFLKDKDLEIIKEMLQAHKPDYNVSDKDKSGVVVNHDAEINYDQITKIDRSWKELNRFRTGSSNRDWDEITNTEVYNYVRFNIMPWYILTERPAEFLDIIEGYSARYLRQWKNYPDNWKEDFDKGVIILGSDARKYLSKVGIISISKKYKKTGTASSSDKPDLLVEYVKEHMKRIIGKCLVVADSLFSYNDIDHYYEHLSIDKLKVKLCKYYLSELDIILSPDQQKNLAQTTITYAKATMFDEESNCIPYDFSKDRRYKNDKVAIVFKNGTLYIHTSEKENGVIKPRIEFLEGRWFEDDYALFSIKHNYNDHLIAQGDIDKFSMETPTYSRSICLEWFKTKFNAKHIDFIQMFFGQLLVPTYNPSVALIIVSQKGGMGKSTLMETLRQIYEDRAFVSTKSNFITSTPLTDLHKPFIGAELASSIINISTELDKKIDNDTLKKVVSRETWTVQKKGIDHFEIRPLAKHLSLANKIPSISPDGGVQRRVAVFEASDKMVRTDITGDEFVDLFIDDYESLIGFMLNGLIKLMRLNFADLSGIFRDSYQDRIIELKEHNSPMHRWLSEEGYQLIEEYTLDPLKKGIHIKDLYEAYTIYCKITGDLSKNISSFKSTLLAETRIECKRLAFTKHIHYTGIERPLLWVDKGLYTKMYSDQPHEE